jgi:hypothetical protein
MGRLDLKNRKLTCFTFLVVKVVFEKDADEKAGQKQLLANIAYLRKKNLGKKVAQL